MAASGPASATHFSLNSAVESCEKDSPQVLALATGATGPVGAGSCWALTGRGVPARTKTPAIRRIEIRIGQSRDTPTAAPRLVW